MFRRQNRSVFLGSRSANRSEKALVKAKRSDRHWMSLYIERKARIQKWNQCFKRFVPLTIARFRYFWAALTSLLSTFFQPVPTRRLSSTMNRDGMLRWGRGKGKGRAGRKNKRARQRLANGNNYEAMEDRKLLAAVVSVEPDNFVEDTILNTAIPEVTLSAPGTFTGNIFANTPSSGNVSTGTKSFGLTPIDNGVNDFGVLRADFNVPVTSVSIDVISDDSNDGGLLEAFDSNGTRLAFDSISGVDGDIGTGLFGAGEVGTLTVSTNTPIAFVTVSSSLATFDFLRFTAEEVSLLDANGAQVDSFFAIQEAIDASDPGQTVVGPNRTFVENIVVPDGAGITLQLQGTIDGTFDGKDDGTTIEAIGDLTIGDGSGAGFSHLGDLNTGSNIVTLLDNGLSQLGETTIVGVGGELQADNGVTLFPLAGTITGSGLVDADISLNAGTVSGAVSVDGAIDGTQLGNGTISPGFSPGILNVGDLTLVAGDVVSIEIDGNAGAGVIGGHDVINVQAGQGTGGTVNLGGATLDLQTAAVATLPQGTSHTIIDNDGTDAVQGTFAGLAEGAQVTLGGQAFTISYQGGDGNDVVLFQVGLIEFAGDSTASENASSANGPTLVVLGDLRTLTEAQRTIDFATPTTTSIGPSSSGTGIGTPGADATSVSRSVILPAEDFSNTAGEFDLFELGNFEIIDDILVEGPEDFEISNITTLGGLALGDADGNGVTDNGVIHTITDNDEATFEISQTATSIAETGETAVEFTISLENGSGAAAQFAAGEDASVTPLIVVAGC